MRVKVIGFNWKQGRKIFLDDFLTYLQSVTNKQVDNSILGVTKKDGNWVGVLLTIRDHQRFCKLVQERGGFTIQAEKLEDNESPVEFNFFLINSTTGRGLYQFYHHSSTLSAFSSICRHYYREYKEKRIAQDTKEGMTDREKDRIRSGYHGTLKSSFWVKPARFSDLIKTLSYIRSFEVEIESIEVEEPLFTPIAEEAKSIRHKLSFGRERLASRLASKIGKFVNGLKDDVKKAQVEGLDGDGNTIIYKLEDNMDILASYDFDELVEDLVIKSSDLEATILQAQMATLLVAISQSPATKQILNTPQIHAER